ncbi:hypothetical protein [Pelagibacterium sediminicola]|uniref:sunset domain-containing protein n=1 Tax=Pelagibacterium sediminicola TaxID=2248761 RepID=UPI001FEABFAA|nr:hypothetical protein [Pelagibacterium sediminicola]
MKLNFLLAGLLAVAALAFSAAPTLAQSGDCVIKGNVNTRGERIYHVPGQRYYNDTVISYSHGERWFCSEAEARAAGWRKSKV